MDALLPSVPFFRPSIGPQEIAEVTAVLHSGRLETGLQRTQFERAFTSFVGAQEAVAVNSCTAALHVALQAVGVERGDLVLVPTMTFAAAAEVVLHIGATPVLVDCDPGTLNLDLPHAQLTLDRIQNGLPVPGLRPPYGPVRAIIPVHYGGQMVDVDAVCRLAARNGLAVIEDAAHALPAGYRRRPEEPWHWAGMTGDITCFSFGAGAPITTGEGGMATTDNPGWAQRMRALSLHGTSEEAPGQPSAPDPGHYEIVGLGFDYAMTALAAALGLRQLPKADRFRRERALIADAYTEALREVEEVELPVELPNRLHAWTLYPIRLRRGRLQIDRAQLIEELSQRGVTTSMHWMPLHMHPYYRDTYGYTPHDLPDASAVYPRLISLPIFPSMTEEEVAFVVRHLKEVLSAARRQTALPRPPPSRGPCAPGTA